MKTHQIELQAILTGNDDGTRRPGFTSLSPQLIDGLNQIYQAAGIKFSKTVNCLQRNSTILNYRFTVPGNLSQYTNKQQKPPVDKDPNTRARTALAAQYPGKLVVYFSYGGVLAFDDHLGHWDLAPDTADYSGWDGFYVSMNQNLPSAPNLAHEIGHYLQLPHTFNNDGRGNPATIQAARDAIQWYVEHEHHSLDEGLDVFDGDRLSVGDTPPDARGTIMEIANGGDECGPVATVPVDVNFSDHSPKTYTIKPDRSLVMSYFKGCPGQKIFSPHQASRIRRGLELGIRHRLITLRPDGLKKLLERRASNSAGGIGGVSIAQLEEQRIASAVITESGKLKLIIWDIADNGAEVRRRGDMEAGPASHVRVCGLACHMVATGHKNADDELELISWRVKGDGSLERLHTATGGSINGLVMCRLVIDYTDYVITAVRDDNDNLKLIAWQITPFGRIVKKAEADGGECDIVSICTMGPNGVMTYVRLDDHKLKAILWEVQSDQILRVENHLTDKPVDDLAACALDVDLAASAVRTQGNLQIITWEAKEGVLSVNRTADSGNQGGPIGELSACRMGTKLLVTAAQDTSHKLKVTLWEIRDKQDVITIHDFDVEETARDVAVCRAGQDLFTTVFRGQDGNLKIVAWQVT